MAHVQKTNSKLWVPESTHEKIDSQKMFVENIEQMELNFIHLDRTMKMYKSLTEINPSFNTSTPINTIISAMANASGLIADIAAEGSSNTVYPTQYGTLYIYKIRSNRVQLEFVSNESAGHKNYNKRWIGQSNADTFGGWDVIYTTSNKPFYTNLAQLGLSNGCHINDVIGKMEKDSVAFFYNVASGGTTIVGLPVNDQCNVVIFKTDVFMVQVHNIWSGAMYASMHNSSGIIGEWRNISDGGNATKVGGCTIITEAYLSTPIPRCATLDALLSQIPENSIFYGYTWEIPAWFPADAIPSTWMLRVIKRSNGEIFLDLDSAAIPGAHYKAGYSYGTTFTGWDRVSAGTATSNVVVEDATVE